MTAAGPYLSKTKTCWDIVAREYRDVIAFLGVSQRWEFKNTTKKFYNKFVSKSFYKTIGKKSQTIFSRFCLSGFGRFLVRGGQKHETGKISHVDFSWVFLGEEGPKTPPREKRQGDFQQNRRRGEESPFRGSPDATSGICIIYGLRKYSHL
jgi:hypothetical protein